jgi:hypothetical protein
MLITVQNDKLVFLGDEAEVVASFAGPEFEAIWEVLGLSEPHLQCSSAVDDPDNVRFLAIVEGAMAEWTDAAEVDYPSEHTQRAQYLGYTCTIARAENSRWVAWASLNSGCRVIDANTTYETEREARAAALRFAYDDTFLAAPSV